MQTEEMTVAAMMSELNQKGISTARGGQWKQVQLSRVIQRLAEADTAESDAVFGDGDAKWSFVLG